MATGKIFLRRIDEVKDNALTAIEQGIKNIQTAAGCFDRNSAYNLRAAITLLEFERDRLKNHMP